MKAILSPDRCRDFCEDMACPRLFSLDDCSKQACPPAWYGWDEEIRIYYSDNLDNIHYVASKKKGTIK